MGVSLGKSEVLYKHPSGKAFKVKTPENGEINIPYGMIHDDSEIWRKSKVGDSGDLVLKEFFAEREGLI